MDQMSCDFQDGQGQAVRMPKAAPPKAKPHQASARLKQLREALGLKQREMANLLGGIPQDHYKHFEGRTRPTREIVAAIEKQFGLPPAAFLSDETIPSTDFNQIIENLRDRTARDPKILIPSSQMVRDTDSRGDADPHIKEGVVGQGSIEFILTTLNEIKADIAKNRQAINELQEGKSKPGFRKGRR